MDDLFQEIRSLCSSIKKKREEELALSLIADYQAVLKSLSDVNADSEHSVKISNLHRELEKKKAECDVAMREKEKVEKSVLVKKDTNAQEMQLLKEKHTVSEKDYPRARYSVNMYRNVSRIKWQASADSNEVRGLVDGKSSAKAFKFDTSKQSQFFITNSLWDMESDKS